MLQNKRVYAIFFSVVILALAFGIAILGAAPRNGGSLPSTATNSHPAVTTNCNHSLYYWATHPERYPPYFVIGDQKYFREEVAAILADSDPAHALLKQTVVAFLNTSAEGSLGRVNEELLEAYQWLADHRAASELLDIDRLESERLVAVLENFNNGLGNLPPCDDPGTPTPTDTVTHTRIPTVNRKFTPTFTPTATRTLSPTPTRTATRSGTLASKATATPTSTWTATRTSPRPYVSPTRTPKPTLRPTNTPRPSKTVPPTTRAPTHTPTKQPTRTRTSTEPSVPTKPTNTEPPAQVILSSGTPTMTEPPSLTPTMTEPPDIVWTRTRMPTLTRFPSTSPTLTEPPDATPTHARTSTSTDWPTFTPTRTPTRTFTPKPSQGTPTPTMTEPVESTPTMTEPPPGWEDSNRAVESNQAQLAIIFSVYHRLLENFQIFLKGR